MSVLWSSPSPSLALHAAVEPAALGRQAVLGMYLKAAEPRGAAAVFGCARWPSVDGRCLRRGTGRLTACSRHGGVDSDFVPGELRGRRGARHLEKGEMLLWRNDGRQKAGDFSDPRCSAVLQTGRDATTLYAPGRDWSP